MLGYGRQSGGLMILEEFQWVFFLFLPLAWLWLVWGNVMIGERRFRIFLERSIAATQRPLQ